MEIFNYPQSIKIQNNNIRYYRQGSGECLVFVHGITTYSFIWKSVIAYFTNKYEVIAIDLLGCGDSEKDLQEDFSLKRQAHLIKDLLSELQIEKAHLVCHDVGGGIGQIFAVNYPKMLYSLCLINSVAYDFWPVQPIIAMRTPIIRQLAMASLDFGVFSLIIKRGLYHKDKCNDELMYYFWKPFKDSSGKKAFLHFAKCLNNQNLLEIEKEISEIEIPTLIIRGEADVYLSSIIAEKLHKNIANSKLIRIKTAGHFLQIDEPEMLSHEILNHISNK